MSALRKATSEFEKLSPCGCGCCGAFAGGLGGLPVCGRSGGGVSPAAVVVVPVAAVVVPAAAVVASPPAAFAPPRPPRPVRAGIGDPAGAFGSKNPAGFGIVDTS